MTKYSVKKPFTVLVGVILVLVLGVVSFLGLNTDLLPTIELPYVVVLTTYPGASPEKVELAVTQPLEQALATTNGLENMQSISQENMSMLVLEFSQSVNMDSVMIELSSNMDMVTGYFDEMVQPPIVMKLNPDMLPVQVMSIDVEGMDVKQLTEYVNTEFAPYLERIDGVATVDVSGAVQDHVEILLNQTKIDQVNDAILKAVNKDLYKAKKELTDGQNKLKEGKSQLEAKQADVFGQLANASAQLDAGMAQAQAIAAEKEKLAAQKAMIESQQKMLSSLGALRPALQGLESLSPFYPDQTTLQQILDSGNPMAAALVQGLIASGQCSGETTFGAAKATLSQSIAQLEAALAQMGVAQDIINSADAGQLDAKLAATTQSLKEADLMAAQMSQTIQKLQDTYATLEKSKMATTAALAVAQAELNSAEKQLESGLKEFENARDAALKQANIDSLVTQSMLSNILTAQNFSMPAGYLPDGTEKLTVKVGEKFASLDQLQNLLLVDMGIDGVAPVYLKDVADVSIQDNSKDNYARVNGNPGIVLSLQKSSVASTSKVAKLVNKATEKLMQDNPNVHITTLMDQGVYIGMIVNSVMQNLLYGGIIAFLVLLVFLKDLRPTLIIGFSIPISLLFSIVLMYFSGVSLNIISLSGLALGVGMLVDNSIVVIENTYRLRNQGYSKIKAAVVGAKQVGGAIFASTLTTICVFLPIVFTQGLSRQIFTDMGLTIGYSLIASLIVALTVVPAMSANMLNSTTEKEHKWFNKMVEGYSKALSWNLKHKWAVIVICFVLLAVSVANAFNMPMAFIPAMDSTQMEMSFTMPLDVEKDTFIQHSEKIADVVSGLEDVQTVGMMSASSGGMPMMGGPSNNQTMSFYVVLKEDKKQTNAQIATAIKEALPQYKNQLTVTESNMDMGALGGSGISLSIKGANLDTLQKTATEISGLLSTVEGIEKVKDGNETATQEIRIDIDKDKAMQHGLTVAQSYQLVSAALSESKEATTLTLEGKDMKAVIHSASQYTKDTIGSLVMGTQTVKGKEKDLLLSDIATIYTASGPKAINRDNQSRTHSVTASIKEGYNVSLVSREVEKILADYTPPAGYMVELHGENETIMQAMWDLFKMIALAIIFIYLIMVAQFQSLLSPFIVLFTIPLAFTGGLLALQFTQMELSITSMIGFLVLAGVVVNNGIVFVDYVNQLRAEGMQKHQALVQAGIDRIRPIMMTALTTILAMSTMAMGVGMGADMSQGMAVVTIGGLSYATLLTLFLVPALYDLLHRREIKNIQVDFQEQTI